MVDFKGQYVMVDKKKGEVKYENNNRTLILRYGILWTRPSAKVDIKNLHPTDHLTLKLFKRTAGVETFFTKIGIDPGDTYTISASKNCDMIIKDGKFHAMTLPPENGDAPIEDSPLVKIVETGKTIAPWAVGLSIVAGLTYAAVKHRHTIKKVVTKS